MAQQQMPRELPDLIIQNAEFVYRTNFSGNAERYNEAGNRYFNVGIPRDVAKDLEADGWNIKWTKPGATHPNPEEHVSEPYLEVTVGYKFRPPTIMLIRDGNGTPLIENTVSLLDSLEFENVDVAIRGVFWSTDAGNSGYKAWLKSLYATVKMDDLDRKYANLLSGPSISVDEEIPAEEN